MDCYPANLCPFRAGGCRLSCPHGKAGWDLLPLLEVLPLPLAVPNHRIRSP